VGLDVLTQDEGEFVAFCEGEVVQFSDLVFAHSYKFDLGVSVGVDFVSESHFE
jgi:hypothetical protein